MSRGGAREGAGRKKGSKYSADAAKKAAEHIDDAIQSLVDILKDNNAPAAAKVSAAKAILDRAAGRVRESDPDSGQIEELSPEEKQQQQFTAKEINVYEPKIDN